LFFLAAGAARYPARKFAATVIGGRALRYGIFAAVAAHYGRHILRYFRHPAQFLAPSLAITAALIAIAVLVFYSRRRWGAVRPVAR
jgi:membrane protein DedA with SNARE-associated domain